MFHQGSGLFYVTARESWFPSFGAFDDRTHYTLHFASPKKYKFVATGRLVKSAKGKDALETDWDTDVPLGVVGFNYGDFVEKSQADSTMTVTAYGGKEIPDELKGLQDAISMAEMSGGGGSHNIAGQMGISEGGFSTAANAQYAAGVSFQALKLFESYFGQLPFKAIAVTEQPVRGYAQSWPALMEALAINKDLPVIAIRTPKVGELSRKERDDIKPLFVSKGGARVFEDFKRIENKFSEAGAKVRAKAGAAADDLLVLVVGSAQSGASGAAHPASKRKVTPAEMAIYASAGLLRVALAQKYSDRHQLFQKGDYRFLWVTSFPMFEYDEGEKRWMAAHHPFTSPHDEDMDKLETDPAMVRALAYDVVLNGTESGIGLIRIHRQDVQSRIFHALGMTEEEARSRFVASAPWSPSIAARVASQSATRSQPPAQSRQPHRPQPPMPKNRTPFRNPTRHEEKLLQPGDTHRKPAGESPQMECRTHPGVRSPGLPQGIRRGTGAARS